MRPVTVSVGPLTSASANAICLSQTPSGAGALTLNGATVTGGVAVLDHARRVLLTTNADETAKTFTVIGTDINNHPITEVLTGVSSSTVATTLDFKTVTEIDASAATAAAITIGTNGVADSMWVRFDDYVAGTVSIQCTASGTVSYTVQQTLDDPNTGSPTPINVTWVNHPDTNFVNATGTVQGNYAYPPIFARVHLNSGSGTVTATFLQGGVAPY